MIISVYLIIVLLCLLILHVAIKYRKADRLIDKIPGPTPLPLFGNLLMFNRSSEENWNKVLQILDDYYPIVRVKGITANYVFARHPDDIEILLSKQNIDKSRIGYDSIRFTNNDGLVISGGEKWRQRRKMLNLAFTPNLLKVYIEIVNEHTEKFIEDLKTLNTCMIPDIIEMMNELALEIVCEAIMGIDPNSFNLEKAKHFRCGLNEINRITFYRASRPYLQDWMMKFLSVGRKLQHLLKSCREFTKKIIHDRKDYHEKNKYRMFQDPINDLQNERSFTNSASKIKRLAVLDLLLDAENRNLVDEKGVNEEVEIFLIAGSETSGVTMAFALMLLAENKAAQELAREEVSEILNRTEGILSIADINKLNFLDRCIKETLRLFPSAPYVGRSIKNITKLRNYHIPEGTEAILHFFSLHRDPNFWPDPEKFDPDRFLPENTEKRHPFAYLPFGAGPRACIGYKFGMLEVKTVVARILHNFYIEPVNSTANMRFQLNIALKPTKPCGIKLIKINRQ